MVKRQIYKAYQSNNTPYKRSGALSIQQGFGMVLLVTFIASTILLASSLSLILSPSIANYVGGTSMNNASAQEIAEIALDNAQNDIFTKLGNGTTVDTSYRYPSSGTNSVTIPTYPSSGSSVSVGTYYVTVTKVRGVTYILNAIATTNNGTVSESRLFQMSNPPSIFSSALAIYSLRQTKSSYAGYAVNVRCATTGTTQDIGFTAAGNFDVASLRTCLGDSSLPLDIDSTAKAAYGLRKLKSSYAGYAIKVRRSSDSTTQNIGFDTLGNLDTVSLLTFVGASSGYIDTWYDQSGNGLNQTQATTAKQPRIVNAGVIDTKNNAPAVYFGGANNLSNTSFSGVVTGQELRFFAIADTESGGAIWGQFAALYKSGDADSYATASGMEVLTLGSPITHLAANTNNNGDYMIQTLGVLFQSTSYHDASGNLKLYYNGTVGFTLTGASNNLAPTSLILGTGAGGDATSYVTGYLGEVILYNSAVSAANQQKIERSQGHYYNISGLQDGFVTTWYDQSGNGRNATQATAANQPVIVIAGTRFANGTTKPAIQFDGSNDTLATAASTAWPSGSSDRTLNGLYQLTATAGNKVVLGWGNIGTGTYSSIFHDLNVGFWGFNADVKTGTSPDIIYGHRIAVIKSGTTVTVYQDGTSLASGTPTLNTTSNTAVTIGSGSGNYMIGNETELVIFNSGLSSTQRAQLETSQSGYYGQ